ncbi:single-stranded DNA-binding protein [Fodinicola feengrottensis]|uniref:Single-stranded DNA-binding protein n=1 Tax=Fodinicola feengrottensis TaxID=435914 RepID=A0ABN2IC88_9ACTN|nr:single-stranded DNA-binding protein [Fodinicola feengrottensis]
MTSEPLVTMTGWLATVPVIKEVRNGQVVCNFTLASTPRRYDREIQAWRDEETLFLRITCWQQMAKNVAASITKGDPIVVHGKFSIRRYEKDGQQRVSNEISAFSVGPNLEFGQAVFTRISTAPAPAQPLREAEVMAEMQETPLAA